LVDSRSERGNSSWPFATLADETTVAIAALEVHEALDDGELDRMRAPADGLAARAERLQNSSWSSLFLWRPDSVRIRAAS
jgi:hypothetical protein